MEKRNPFQELRQQSKNCLNKNAFGEGQFDRKINNMSLNESQLRACEHFKGPALVIAGPGSGKTTVITRRVRHLIEERGVSPKDIIVITFTKAAALEMMERFNRNADSGLEGQVSFGTFHSFFYGILKEELSLKSDQLLTGARKQSLLKEACLKVKDVDKEDIAAVAENIEKEISFIKNSGVSFDEYQSTSAPKAMVLEAFKHYEAMKSRYGLIDFDDMLTRTKSLFCSDERILKKWQERYRFYLIDEAQDMNGIQYDIIRMLCAGEKNLFMVGDDDQSIYGFRGAKPSIMLDFPKDFSDCETILLDHNYRCAKEIAEASLALIDNNSSRYKKAISFSEAHGLFEVLDSKSYAKEAQLIAEDISQKLKEGADPKSMAVLYRHHQCARLIVEQFIERQIPFYLKDHMPNIYTHFVMEDMAAYLEIAAGNATRARMIRIINKPNRYILRQALEKDYSFKGIKSFYGDNPVMYKRICALERDFLLLGKMTPFAAVNYIRRGMDYEGYLKKLAFEKGMDFSELMSVLEMFSSLVKDCKTTREAIEKLNYLKLEVDYKNKNSGADKMGVGLYTLHSSKGLEFDSVYICDVNEGVIPSKKANSSALVEEERRLFYVGVTRAKKELKLFYVTEKNRERLYPSRFISEIKHCVGF